MMICLSDLPSGIIAHVSSFLASPSRALFAVALTSRDVERSSAILGDEWDALDFGDIEKELAAKISDKDISGVLLCIDAVNKLKKLRLANCINITGVGLEPLRGSTIIEQIDLSLVGDHESPELDPEPPISCAEVLPILDSIIERWEESALKHLQFPKVWRKERNTESDFHAFLPRYHEFLQNRAVSCWQCNCNLPGEYDQMIQMRYYVRMLEMGRLHLDGTQNYTCCNCMKHYCHDCQDDDGVACLNGVCDKCERLHCSNCSREGNCAYCDDYFCADCCDFRQCIQCQENTCPECAVGCNSCDNDNIWCYNCVDLSRCCRDCNKCYCAVCCDSNVQAVQFCNDCEESLCGQCRVNKCKERRNCTGCCQLALPALLEDKERQRQEMQNEIDELRKELV